MKPYNPKAKCPKCGCEDVRCRLEQKEYRLDKDGEYMPIVEFLVRTCTNCYFTWPEACLDAKENER